MARFFSPCIFSVVCLLVLTMFLARTEADEAYNAYYSYGMPTRARGAVRPEEGRYRDIMRELSRARASRFLSPSRDYNEEDVYPVQHRPAKRLFGVGIADVIASKPPTNNYQNLKDRLSHAGK